MDVQGVRSTASLMGIETDTEKDNEKDTEKDTEKGTEKDTDESETTKPPPCAPNEALWEIGGALGVIAEVPSQPEAMEEVVFFFFGSLLLLNLRV
jgi:hypothetical protein